MDGQWIDRSQPQTLQSAVLLAYFNAAFVLFFFLFSQFTSWIGLILIANAICSYWISNERRLAYYLAIILTGIYLASQIIGLVLGSSFEAIVSLLFAVLAFGLLVHTQSREYQKIWFR